MPAPPSWMNGILAPLMRLIVTPAAPDVMTVASLWGTIPMSLARIERTGPAFSGTCE